MPDSVLLLGEGAFRDAGLTRLVLSNCLTTIPRSGSYENTVTTLVIPDLVTEIGPGAFIRSPLTSLTLADSLVLIRSVAFSDHRLTSVTIPSSVTSIEMFALTPLRQNYGRSISTETIPILSRGTHGENHSGQRTT